MRKGNSKINIVISSKLKNNIKLTRRACLFLLLTVGVALLSLFSFSIFDKNIKEGVSISGVPVGGLPAKEALERIKSRYPSDFTDKAMTFRSGSMTEKIKYTELGIGYDYEAAVDEALKKGRQGNFLQNVINSISQRFCKSEVSLTYEFDEAGLNKAIYILKSKFERPVHESSYEIKGLQLSLQNGKAGIIVKSGNLKQQIKTALNSGNNLVNVEQVILMPKPFIVVQLHNHIYRPAIDARYEIRKNEGYLVPEQNGMDFDKVKAETIIEENRNNENQFFIPMYILRPKIYSKDVEQQLFKDILSDAASIMTSHDEDRMNNLRLAALKINGTILNPNDIFSYNACLGDVSYENGFKDATIYSEGKLDRGVGGGVCQISSVLYSAALQANLEIIRRSNHSFPVEYLPLGEDAAFAANEKDLRFKNTTGNPIKITTSVDSDGAYVTISGTNPDRELSISIENLVKKVIPYTTVRSTDPTLPDDTVMIMQRGMNGYEIDTYRILRKNNKVIRREFISRSRYSPLDQIESVSVK